MSSYLGRINESFFSMWKTREGISFRKVRLSRLCYMLAYSIELILYSVRNHFMPIDREFCGLPGRFIVLAVYGISSLVIMLLWSRRFKHLVWISVLVMIAGFVPFILLPDSDFRLLYSVTAYAGLGGAVTSARCGYAFALNNAERLLGIVIMYLSCTVVRYIDTSNFNELWWAQVLPMLLVIALSVCLIMFREKDLEVKEESSSADAKSMYWALAYFIMYFAVDGYTFALLDSSNRPAYKFLLAGTLLSATLLIVMLAVLRLNVWHVWNVFFVSTLVMAVLAVLTKQIGSACPHYFVSGLSLTGWPLCIYMLACVQRRFASYALLKKCTIIFVIFSPIAGISDDIVEEYFPSLTPTVTLVISIVLIVTALLLSPLSYRDLFSKKWIVQLSSVDMDLIREKVEKKDKFEDYSLTSRQKEIATMLLAAKTRRQIAGELGVSESTVKNHTSELYKKLGINSRVELFKIFGVSENQNEE